MQKLLQLLSKYILPALLLFFLAFIPLYPKFPLLDIFGTWVYIRIEDFLVALAVVLLGITVLFKKNSIKTSLTIPIIIYWVIGLVSTVIAILFIFPQLQNIYPHIALLHYARRIEYMVLFFLAFAVISKNKKVLPYVVSILVVTGIAVIVYGVGQKYAGWPAFSTMNEEFAKGLPLRLPPTARIMSTFAGHYDLAAYLVLTIPIFGSMFFGTKKMLVKLILLATAIGSFVLLLLTASRVSFGVYLLTVGTMLWWQKKRWLIVPVVIASIVMVNFVSGASDRFLKTLRFNDVVVDLSTGKPIGTLEKVEGGKAVLERVSEPDEENLPKGSGFIGVPNGTQVPASSDIDKIEFIKKKDLVAGKGDVATVSGSFLVQRAFVLDISITTRFQGQWPRAIEAFKRNPLTGSGFSSLSLAADGNYHRMLGETGIIGTIAFLGIFLYAFYIFWKRKDQLGVFEKSFVVGTFAGIVGIFANAVLIDVFEASKVAFPLWMFLGVTIAILGKVEKQRSYGSLLWSFFSHKYMLCLYVVVGAALLFGPMISSYFIGDDFTWLRWAAETSFKDILHYFTNAQGFFYRPIPKLWYFGLFSFFWLVPHAYHIASLGLLLSIVFLLFLIAKKLHVRPIIAAAGACVFMVLSVHHENIMWISGHSSLLAVNFFLISLYLFILSWRKEGIFLHILKPAAVISLVCSMLSWESMIVAPLILFVLGFAIYKKKSIAWILLFIPLYIVVRTLSGAVPPSGDYNINVYKFPVNALGNTIIYTASILIGPRAIEYGQLIREQMRSSMSILMICVGMLSGVMAGICILLRKKIRSNTTFLALSVSYLLALLPFVGLGAASERYALFASVFFMLAFLYSVENVIQRKSKLLLKICVVVFFVVFSFWNISEMQRLVNEWVFAGTVTEQTLKSIRTGFFPSKTPPSFVFISTPIRQGRAWIFPTGLNDALWHMYRQSPYYVYKAVSEKDAFEMSTVKDTDKIILQFTDFKLQQVVKETR